MEKYYRSCDPARQRQMSQELDRLGKELISRRSFGVEDRQILTPEAIEQLRDHGDVPRLTVMRPDAYR